MTQYKWQIQGISQGISYISFSARFLLDVSSRDFLYEKENII